MTRTYKDYKVYEPNLEPRDFTRIHDNDLSNMRALLVSCYQDYSHPNFTDRYNMAERLKRVLSVGRKDE